MRTDEEAWLREQLRLDAPPPMTPLDGMETLSRGRSRRRRHRIATATPLAVAGVAVLGTALWAGQLLPDAVQDALPAVSGVSEQCPDLAPIGTSPTTDGGAGTQVTSDVAPLTVLDWETADGTKVVVIRTLNGCLVPAERQGDALASGVGLSMLSQVPGGPLVLHGSRDPGEGVRRWGASLLEVPGQAEAVAILPDTAQRVTFAGGEPVDRLTPVLGAQDQVLAQVARVSHGEDEDPPALLWHTGDEWSLLWSWVDIIAEPDTQEWGSASLPAPTAELPSSSEWPQLARTESEGQWWIWLGDDVVLGPVAAPEGAWAIHLTDDERGDAFVGWVPEQTDKLIINGEPWDLLAMEHTIGEPMAGLKPFVRDVYQSADEILALQEDGGYVDIPLIGAPSDE